MILTANPNQMQEPCDERNHNSHFWEEMFKIMANGTVDLVANYITVTMRRDVYGVGFRTSVNKSVAWQFFDYVFNSF